MVFGYYAAAIGNAFFPSGNPFVSLMLSLMTFGAGFLMRPLGAIVLAYIIWSRGIQRLGPARTSMYSNVTPVVVMLLAWPLLSETPTAWQVLGAAGIFTGLWLTRS